MTSLRDLADASNELLSCHLFKDFCTNGIQVGSSRTIKKLGLAVSPTLAAIEEVIAHGCDALLVHHGLFWNHDSHVIEGTRQKKLAALLKADVGLLAYHLPLDAHKEVGNNWGAFMEMGFEKLAPFGKYNDQTIGVRAEMPPTPIEEVIAKLEKYYGQKAHASLGGPKLVRTIGLISGGAYKSVLEAAAAGLDCYVTGSFDEPAWYWAQEEKIHFLAMGHSATETIGPRRLGAWLAKRFGLETHFVKPANPF